MMHTATAKAAVRRIVSYVAGKGAEGREVRRWALTFRAKSASGPPCDPWADRTGLVRGVVRLGVVLAAFSLARGAFYGAWPCPLG